MLLYFNLNHINSIGVYNLKHGFGKTLLGESYGKLKEENINFPKTSTEDYILKRTRQVRNINNIIFADIYRFRIYLQN